MDMLTVCFWVLSLGLLVNCNIDVPDNSGKEFIIAFMDNTFINNDSLNVFLTTNFPSPIQVRINAHSSYLHYLPQSNKTVSVRRGSVTRVNIPVIFAMKDTNRDFKGVRLSADKEFIVYGSNAEPYSLDAFIALPVGILGLEYIAGSYSGCSSNFPALIGLVGVHNSTHIDITPVNGSNITVMGHTVSSKKHIILNRLETIQIQSTSDITGTRINSSKPLVVMSGNKCAKVPCGHSFSCDHLVEQMYPVDRWGYTFTVVPSAYRQSGDIVRVVGSTDDTAVDITGVPRLILHRSEFYEFNVSKNAPVYVNASKPIMVLQFTQSQDTDGLDSDPYMMVVPAIEQFSTSYTIATANLPDKDYKNFVNIVIKSSSKEGLRVDGAALNGVTWLAIPGTDFAAVQLNITEGTHRIEHISPIQTFSVCSYGFAESVSYGYPGGLRLANLDMTKCVPNTGQPADGVDNDCDMKIDEELFNGIDDDDDGVIDEDLSSLPPEVDFPKDAVIVSGNASVILYLMGQLSSPNVTSSERCTVYSNITVNHTDSTTDNGCGMDIKRTWLVQDGCGNIVRSVQTILVYNSWQALRAHSGQNCTGMVEVVGCNDTADAGQCTTAPCQGNQGFFMLAGGLGCYCARSLDNAWCLQGENLTTTEMPELMLTTERVRPSTDYIAIETTSASPVLTWSTGKTRQHAGYPTVETTPESPMLTWSTGKARQHTGSPTVETTPESPMSTLSTGKKGQHTGYPTVETTPESPMLTLSTEKKRQHTGYPTVETTPESPMLTLSTGKKRQHTGYPTVETTPESPMSTLSAGKKGQHTGYPTVETTTETWLDSTSKGSNDSGGEAAGIMNPEGSKQGLTIILPAVAGVILLCGVVIATALWVLKRMKRSKTSPAGEENGDPSSTQKDINDSREDPQEESPSDIPYVPPTTGAIPIPPTLTQFSMNSFQSGSDRLQSKDTDSSHEDQFGKTGEHSVSDDGLYGSATGGATVPHDLPPVSGSFDQTDQNIQRRLPARLPPLKKE